MFVVFIILLVEKVLVYATSEKQLVDSFGYSMLFLVWLRMHIFSFWNP